MAISSLSYLSLSISIPEVIHNTTVMLRLASRPLWVVVLGTRRVE